MSGRFVEVEPSWLPPRLEFADIESGQVLFAVTVDAPGGVAVPSFGRPVRTRVSFADGIVVVEPPAG